MVFVDTNIFIAALNLYDLDQVLRINLELSGLTSEKLVVLISSTPLQMPSGTPQNWTMQQQDGATVFPLGP